MDPSTDIGPVIDKNTADEIRRYIENWQTRRQARTCHNPFQMVLKKQRVVITLHPTFSLASRVMMLLHKKKFLDLFSLLYRVKDFDEALEVANSTEYKLTGRGYIVVSQRNLEKARKTV